MKITNLTYSYDASWERVTIYTTGEKIWDKDGDSGTYWISYSYQLLDSEGYIVDTGDYNINNLQVGDKYRDDYIRIYDIKPGNYTLRIMDNN